jgi:beta-glucosidase
VFNGNQPAGTDSTFDQMMATQFPDTDLSFDETILTRAKAYGETSRLITLVDLNRPAVLSELNSVSDAMLGTFGISDQAMLDVVFGRHTPTGKLPFELPSSMAEVEQQLEDVPDDTANPLFPFGWGLSYSGIGTQ